MRDPTNVLDDEELSKADQKIGWNLTQVGAINDVTLANKPILLPSFAEVTPLLALTWVNPIENVI